jgi:integrase
MPTIKLTQAAVERLRPPASGRVEYWDSQLPGFGLRVSAPRPGSKDGRRTWQAMYRVNGRLARETIGTMAVIPNVAEAREIARESLRKAQQGIDPTAERRRAEEAAAHEAGEAAVRARDTLGSVIDRYLAERAKPRMRPDYYKEASRALLVDVVAALGDRPIRDLTRREIRELIGAIVARGRAPHAAHVLSYLRTALNWAVGQEIIAESRAAGIPDPDPRQRQDRERDRVLKDAELGLFWLACDKLGWPFGPLFKLLVLTAQRRDEVAAASWDEFDIAKAVWILPENRTKNGRQHLVHLAPAVTEILAELPRLPGSNLLFTTTGRTPVSGFGRAKERVAALMQELSDDQGIEPFTLHDLRRSAATGMAELGIAHHVLDKVLNHSAGKISGVARIYNRHSYEAERQAALGIWAQHVTGLVHPPAENVIALAVSR